MRFFAALLSLSIVTAPAAAEQDGERLFAACRACHSLEPAEHGLPGPNLAGVIGRKIGGDPAFDYSPALRKARDEGLRWDTEQLETFLADPEQMFPGLWMSMRGIEDAADRRSLVRYLAASPSH